MSCGRPFSSTLLSDSDVHSLNTSVHSSRSTLSSLSVTSTSADLLRSEGRRRAGSIGTAELLRRSGWRTTRGRRHTQTEQHPSSGVFSGTRLNLGKTSQQDRSEASADLFSGVGDHLGPATVSDPLPSTLPVSTVSQAPNTQQVPQIIVSLAPSVPGVSGDTMATVHQPPMGLFEAADLLRSNNVTVKFGYKARTAADINTPILPHIQSANMGGRQTAATRPEPTPSRETQALSIVLNEGAQVDFLARVPTPPMPVTCDVCQDTFASDTAYQHHRQNNDFGCPVCKEHFSVTANADHMRRRHPAVPESPLVGERMPGSFQA